MKCPSCHTSIVSDDRFCQNCGQLIAVPAPVPAAAAAAKPRPHGARRLFSIVGITIIVYAAVVAIAWPKILTWLDAKTSPASTDQPSPRLTSGTLTETSADEPTTLVPQSLGGNTQVAPPTEVSAFTAQQLTGSWRGGRHLTEFRADGTFLLDADIVPEPAGGLWRLEGRRLTQTYREGNAIVLDIVSLAGREMTTRDPQSGQEFKLTREDNAYLNPDALPSGEMTGDEFLSKGLRLRALKGKLVVFDAGPPMVLPGSRKKVIIVDGGFVSAMAFEFDPPVRSFTLTLPAVTSGASFPTFKMTAFDRAGAGHNVIGQEHWIPEKPIAGTITMNSGEIARIELEVDNRFGDTAWATFNCLPILDMLLER